MKKRIFKNMCLLAGGICVLAYTFLFFLFNFVYGAQTEQYVRNETRFLAEMVNEIPSHEASLKYMENLDCVDDARITWIDKNGTVLFDSHEDWTAMENHGERPEVREALDEGASSVVRQSTTLQERTIYYAVLLEDGTVLRMSMSTDSVYALYISMLPVLIVILLIFIGIVMVLAHRMTDAIVRPINNLDLVKPENGCPYEELEPLLARIHRQNEERQKNEKMRREFSANVSHELKTPLTSISGYAELMKDGMVQAGDVPVFAEKIYKEAARLIGLVNDIIKISRLDERKIGIEKEPVELYAMAEDICQRLETVAQKFKVSLDVQGEDVVIQGVPQMIDELIYNLCENAIKYNQAGGSVHVRISRKMDKAQIVVEDTGIGIPKEHLDRVFERFYRVDKSHSRQTGGTGLGLAIVKHVVEYHDGSISLESEEGKGTKITVLL
ncbi:MAG TPA: ATP-binding protein [Candidatus Scybalocola faecigallinarum]|uniref:histidine kinase n=1 Tax=Candidatus Scybalocola faecigallinarum TaxID=2840941 RepID=A0A9D1F6I0_9FIRM|nr:ATP-binding protein [Candidatus Scybalocola faecigallinarum]